MRSRIQPMKGIIEERRSLDMIERATHGWATPLYFYTILDWLRISGSLGGSNAERGRRRLAAALVLA